MPARERTSLRPAFYDAPVAGQSVSEWAESIGAWDHPEDLPYADLPWSEPLATDRGDEPEPVAEASGPYERPVLHPNDPEFREAAVRWGRREREREVAYNVGANGAVISFGFERQSNEAMHARFAAIEEEERRRREAEDSRTQWCEDVLPECWPTERDAWCDVGHDPFGSDDQWAWCNEDHHAWCLDSGGGWCGEGEDGFWEGADGFWTGEWGEDAWMEDEDAPRWTRADDRRLRAAYEEWCQED